MGPGASQRAIVNADSLSALVRDGERLQELFNNVQVRQDTTRLRSNFALRYLNRDELLFTGDVVIYERGDTLRADTVRYDKRTKVGRAWSNVSLTDGEVTVRAPRAIYYTEEKRSVFPDSVTLIDSAQVLRAQSGTYWSNARRAEFQGNVQLTDPETHLEADSLTYYRDRERSIASGRVFIRRVGADEGAPQDTTTRTYLFGQWADNQEQNRYSHVQGNALLMRVRLDSTGAPSDTLLVRGRRLEAFRTDTHRRLIAVDSVRIWQKDLAAVADSTVYDRVVATGPLDTLATPSPIPDTTAPAPPSARRRTASAPAPNPSPADTTTAAPPDTSAAPPDSSTASPGSAVPQPSPDTAGTAAAAAPADTTAPSTPASDTTASDTTASDTTASDTTDARPEAKNASRWAPPTARTDAELPLEDTRLFRAPVTWFDRSQVWGDSIRVRSRRRSIDTVFVRGRAFAAQRDSTLDRVQQLKGKDLTAYFRADSLRRLVAAPNARAIRFLKTRTGTLKGAARVSGDRIVLHFRDGEVQRTSVLGGVESTYYRTPETVPDPFHLDGFQWTPERTPTKKGLLRQPRVRKRLALPPPGEFRPRPSRARPDSLRARPDSLATPSTPRPDTSQTAVSTQ
jgi:lipopolysaccharide export system protein LptA